MNTVENVNHAVLISGFWIYDSDYKKPLPLIKESLDLIYYYYDGDEIYFEFKMVYYAVGCVKPKENSKCEKYIENDWDVQIYIYIYIYMTNVVQERNKKTSKIS